MPSELPVSAREWIVTGHVQGVGFRRFVMDKAHSLELRGWVRNEPAGEVRVYAVGPDADLDRLAGHLYLGPRMSIVRGVEQVPARVQQLSSFRLI